MVGCCRRLDPPVIPPIPGLNPATLLLRRINASTGHIMMVWGGGGKRGKRGTTWVKAVKKGRWQNGLLLALYEH